MFLRDKEIGLQHPFDERKTDSKNGPSDLVQVPLPRMVTFDHLPRLFQNLFIQWFSFPGIRVKTDLEKTDQLQGDVRIRMKGVDDHVLIKAIRLLVCQEGVAKCNKGIGQRGLFSCEDSAVHKIHVRDAGGGKNLGIVQFIL